jgi:hypothetical protein
MVAEVAIGHQVLPALAHPAVVIVKWLASDARIEFAGASPIPRSPARGAIPLSVDVFALGRAVDGWFRLAYGHAG